MSLTTAIRKRKGGGEARYTYYRCGRVVLHGADACPCPSIPGRDVEAFVVEQRGIYETDVDLLRLASELVVDAVIEWEDLRTEVHRRLLRAAGKDRTFSSRRHGVPPV